MATAHKKKEWLCILPDNPNVLELRKKVKGYVWLSHLTEAIICCRCWRLGLIVAPEYIMKELYLLFSRASFWRAVSFAIPTCLLIGSLGL
jgi:hypothetical protein